MKLCRKNFLNECIFLTKDNKYELLKIIHPSYLFDESKIKEVEKEITIEYNHIKYTYYYNYWYVKEFNEEGDSKFEYYTQEQFSEKYELV